MIDKLGNAAAWLETTDVTLTDEQKELARRYMIKRGAGDLIGMLSL